MVITEEQDNRYQNTKSIKMFASIPLVKENRMVKSTLKEMNINAAWVLLLLRASRFVYSDPEKKEIKAIAVLYLTRSCFSSQPTTSLLNNSN